MADPELVQTELGPVEVSREGQGPPVLFLHGTPGGWDASMAMGRFLVEAGFELLAPSRPGYLGTPLGERGSFDQQADLFAAMLRELDREGVGVICWSGGGPSSYRFAVRHPDTVSALVVFAGVSKTYEADPGLDERFMMETRVGNWLTHFATSHLQRTMVRQTLKAEGDLTREELKERTGIVLADDRRLELVLELANVIGDYPRRRAGIRNDRAGFAAIESLELERVRATTLVIHGSVDTDVPPEHGEYAAATIPGAQLLMMDRGTHLCLFTHPDAEAAQARVVEALRA
jgi:pimeloyl-ACP methyl ester carboxylesterase